MLGGSEVVVGVHLDGHSGGDGVKLGDHPAVKFATLWHRPPAAGPRQIGVVEQAGVVEQSARIEAVDPGVDHEEGVDVPESQEKLGDTLLDGPLAIADARPRGLAGEKKPAECVSAELVEDLSRLAVVPLALAHLLAVLAEHVAEDDAGLERMRRGAGRGAGALPEQERANGELAVEPAPRLVDRLGDEISWKLSIKLGVPAVWPAPLGERHRA